VLWFNGTQYTRVLTLVINGQSHGLRAQSPYLKVTPRITRLPSFIKSVRTSHKDGHFEYFHFTYGNQLFSVKYFAMQRNFHSARGNKMSDFR
jgi:hypothetical protein